MLHHAESRIFVAASFLLLGLLASGCDGEGGSAAGTGGPDVAPDHCTVRVRYTGSGHVDAATLWVDYSNVVGGFGPPGNTTVCRTVPAAATGSLVHNVCDDNCSDGEERSLNLVIETGQAFDANFIKGPSDLFRCDFTGDSSTLPALHVALGDLTTPDFQGLPVDIAFLAECGDDQSSTTTTSTTSTTICEGPDCSDREVSVELWLDDAVSVGSLQFKAGFACGLGRFKPIPSKTQIQCKVVSPDASLFSTHEDTDGDEADAGCQRLFRFGMVSTQGLLGPQALVTCTFVVASDSPDPTAEDFTLDVEDASGPDVSPIPFPAVSLRGFEPIEH